MFKQITGYKIERKQFGTGGAGTITVFRSPPDVEDHDIWQKTNKGTILIIGGPALIRELKRLWSDRSRPRIQELFPISSSTHQKIKIWLAGE